ncbi:DNA ligase D [Sediminibacillus massiliensis]|uniref:DNA ligase D n=1 Tax=Sediminibacillus massiliensis TaxID=1926277 RepID=UPI001FEC5965|nr:DNA ligase D [Sediminibacillus massiliensis]
MRSLKLMQPIASEQAPEGKEWVYEIKYDGFRAVLEWSAEKISLISRNGKDLTDNFPEIVSYCNELQELAAPLLPLRLDGEIVILNTIFQANFSLLQQRGRFKSEATIKRAALKRPAHFLCFDLLQLNGKGTTDNKYTERKNKLRKVFERIDQIPAIRWDSRIGFIDSYPDLESIWSNLFTHKGEGIVAKRAESTYTDGKKHNAWLKIKNWRNISGIMTNYDQGNGYFELAVYEKEELKPIGKFKHGLEGKELETLKTLLVANAEKQGNTYHLPPAICMEVHCLDVKEGELREPLFNRFRFDMDITSCTLEKVQESLAMIPETIELSNQDKIFYEKEGLLKRDFLLYLREMTPYILPFLSNRALTVIRCPDGVEGDSFFQKHLPDYAPVYIAGEKSGDDTLLHCGSVEALIWLGNHGALEYHVPFQKMGKPVPVEIVFDLDPPSIKEFPLAVFAAKLIKRLIDQFQLEGFIKTSGNKGLQVYIPIPENSLSYDQTAAFTQAIAFLIEKQHSDLFTTERLKKNRKGRLYIDYVQHGKDKTLIAPYSPRKNPKATVSTPLYWEEVTDQLSPEQFTIKNVAGRVKEKGCPFAGYEEARGRQPMEIVKNFISESGG